MASEVPNVETLAAQLGDLYDRYDRAERDRHVELLASVTRPGEVALDVARRDHDTWRITVCTSDCLGALSVIAGLFTAYRFDILSADIFTVHVPDRAIPKSTVGRSLRFRRSAAVVAPRPPSHKLLDVFDVRPLVDEPLDVWDRFRADLTTYFSQLVGGQREQAVDEVVERVSASFADGPPRVARLLPISTEFVNDPASPYTRLTVRSIDTPGFLFAFTFALAGFAVNIERAQVRSTRDEAVDTFWVTDVAGRPIVDEERIHDLRVATALVKHFSHLLPRSPNPAQALRQFNALIQQMLSRPQWTAEIGNLESPAVLETLADLMGVSRFLWEDFLRLQHENLFPVVVDLPALQDPMPKEQLESEISARLAEAESHADRVAALNAFKDREMFRIDLRHITGRSTFESFSAELSILAEVTVDAATRISHEALADQFGVPRLSDGRECPLSVAALGKFGGAELGFGSDLELIFVYEGDGRTDGPVVILNAEYFERFVQEILRTLRARQEGIFEIDLRLRPHGRAGSLATTLAGFSDYYSDRGDAMQFERMALVKLRPIVGSADLGARLVHARDAFVYSGAPLDLENVRHLRHRQATELVPTGRISAKYSHGGLVDVEYFVQAWQIVVGHTDPSVRVTNTLAGIAKLAEGGHFSSDLATELRDCYAFLRRLIDALRVVRGHAKDLTIPAAASREFAYLAHRLHFTSTAAFEEALGARMAFASGLWEAWAPGSR